MEKIANTITTFKSYPTSIKLFSLLGLYTFTKFSFSLLSWVKKNLLSFKQDLKAKYGDGWVVITGASDGIGFGYVEEFIKYNFKVCLIARNEEKLKSKISFLKEKYPESKLAYIVYDFNKTYTEEEYTDLKSKITATLGDDISVLVNNVGIAVIKPYKEMTLDEISSMVNVNVKAMLFTSKIVLEIMEKRKTRSLVISSGSVCGRIRPAGYTLYSGSKSYMEAYMEVLSKEYSNIDFTCFEIGAVATPMNDEEMVMKISPLENAHSALLRAGKYKFTTPHIKHEIFRNIFWCSPIVRKLLVPKGYVV